MHVLSHFSTRYALTRRAKKNLTDEKVIAGATRIAHVMLTTETLGMEAPFKDLIERIPGSSTRDIVDVLKYSCLGRLGSGDQQRFSFVHRRFNEYFVVQQLMRQPEQIPLDAIPTDSRWRDALVLYCEVANENEARRVANFCWSEIESLTQDNFELRDPLYLRGIHCLRFLQEAFRSRLNCIDPFRAQLSRFVSDSIDDKRSLLSMKLAVEAVCLLDAKDMDVALVKALRLNNSWINETALKACRYLTEMSKDLNRKLMLVIDDLDSVSFFRQRHEMMFSLRLSNVLDDLTTFCLWRTIDCYLVAIGWLMLFFLSPVWAILTTWTMYFSCNMLSFGLTRRGFGLKFRTSLSVMDPLFRRGPLLLVGFVTLSSIFRGWPVWKFSAWPTESIVIPVMAAVFGSFLIPWYQYYYYVVAELKWVKITDLRSIALAVLVAILFWPLFKLSELTSNWLSQMMPSAVALYSGAVCAALLLLILIRYVMKLAGDFRYLEKLPSRARLNRQQLYDEFMRFKTARGRLFYVLRLQDQHVVATGDWPNGQLPRIGTEQSSTLLAQLEEEWLGLDE